LSISSNRSSSCAGAYNAFSGRKKAVVSIYCKYITPKTSQPFYVGKYKGMPAIVSKDCTTFGVLNGLDGGMICLTCKNLRLEKGSGDPATVMNRWAPTLNRCEERRHKDVYTDTDLIDAKRFAKSSEQQLTPAGMDLKIEAQGQVDYGRYMASICNQLPPQSFKTIGENSAPGLDKFLGDVADCWKANPDFRSGLQVALVKAAIAKSKSGNKSKMGEKVLNFYRFLNTYDKKATQVLSANLGGPSDRYLKILNASERDSCILCNGKDTTTTDLGKRIDAAIIRRSNNEGDRVTFAILALTLFFVRLHLHAVNGTSVPAKHRVIYLWCSMVWLTSISGASMITKRNIVAETISFAFIMMSSDVSKPRYCTSEPVEHTFGQLRTMIREFTTLEFAQLYEKLIRRLEKMYKFGFNPSRDPNKGYSSTFRNYFKYSVATKQPLMEGTVQLLMNGDFVAKQLWSAVNELINYSSTLMTPFLSALGVTNDNCSPFSRKFTSLTDLRDEFILYLPSTFDFDNVHGRSRDEEASDDNDGGEDESQSLADIMQERVIQFQQSIVAISEEKDGAVTEEEESVDDDVVVVDDPAGDDVSTTDEYAKLMIAFKAILSVTSGADILSKVLPAASCLEGKDTVSGAVSFERKSKSLLGRWIGKAADSGLGKDALVSNNQVVIERDTIILVNSKFGTGARAATLSCHFRVVNIYEKYYNKWFMSKHPFKKWKCEAKPYKLEVRMVNKDVLDEYTDEELCGDSHYVDDEICKIVEDRYILNVVGKLEQHGVLP
jgi:hypothetical protein